MDPNLEKKKTGALTSSFQIINKYCIIKILFPCLNKYSELLISVTNPTVKIVLLLYGKMAKKFSLMHEGLIYT